MEKIALVAGKGELPVIFAEEAKKRGAQVTCFALKGSASPRLEESCAKTRWLDASQVKQFVFLLIMDRPRKIVMLGKFDKSVLLNGAAKENEAARAIGDVRDNMDYSLLAKITAKLDSMGIELISGEEYLGALLPPKGVLTKRKPSPEEEADIEFGYRIAKEAARLDIGQAVAVKRKAIVSVEAMEGTDETIKRASAICKSGFSLVKVSRPSQDMRWDVPVVGLETLKTLSSHGGKALAIEEKKMYMIEPRACAEFADKNGISIVVI